MVDRYSFVTITPEGLILNILVQPRSSRDQILGVQDNHLKIALTAPPVEGEANRACVQFIAELLDINRSKITILSGHKSRKKRILIKTENPSRLLESFPL